MNRMDDDRFMGLALAEAEKALDRGDFPVGCVMVHRGRVVARGCRRGTAGGGGNELDHAEILALRRLMRRRAPVDPAAVTAYCTLEPCLMCFGALLIHGIGEIVYAYEDVMGGGTACERSRLAPLYRDRRVVVRAAVRRGESLALFKRFFRNPKEGYWRGSLLARSALAEAE